MTDYSISDVLIFIIIVIASQYDIFVNTILHPDCGFGATRPPFLLLSPLLPMTDDTAPARRIRENTFTSGQTSPGPRLPPRQSNLYSVSHILHSAHSLLISPLLALSHFSLSGKWALSFFKLIFSVIEKPIVSVSERDVRA